MIRWLGSSWQAKLQSTLRTRSVLVGMCSVVFLFTLCGSTQLRNSVPAIICVHHRLSTCNPRVVCFALCIQKHCLPKVPLLLCYSVNVNVCSMVTHCTDWKVPSLVSKFPWSREGGGTVD